jgi:uncharacterized protein YjiS (DUF1127 family)
MSRSLLLTAVPVRLPAPADAPPAPRGLIGRLVLWLVLWQDRWRQRRDLESLSEAQLADIGLTRSEAQGWVRGLRRQA